MANKEVKEEIEEMSDTVGLTGQTADFFRDVFRESLDDCVDELILLKYIAAKEGFMVSKNPLDYSPPQQLFIQTFIQELKEWVSESREEEEEESCQQKT